LDYGPSQPRHSYLEKTVNVTVAISIVISILLLPMELERWNICGEQLDEILSKGPRPGSHFVFIQTEAKRQSVVGVAIVLLPQGEQVLNLSKIVLRR
jgi:hypothetical protein